MLIMLGFCFSGGNLGYKTVLKETEAEIIEKKSRFIVAVKPVFSLEEAEEFVQSVKKIHYKATHNVFAFRCGERNEVERQSDDGEPQGTAGMPMLEVLRKMDIHNVAVVVTRYFGGIMLGAGGLVRAYGNATKEGILAAGVLENIKYCELKVKADYSFYGKLKYELLNFEAIIADTDFSSDIVMTVLVLPDLFDSLVQKITDITAGDVSITDPAERYTRWLDGELLDY